MEELLYCIPYNLRVASTKWGHPKRVHPILPRSHLIRLRPTVSLAAVPFFCYTIIIELLALPVTQAELACHRPGTTLYRIRIERRICQKPTLARSSQSLEHYVC